MNPSPDFQQHVIDSLARLETNMLSLIGNGQPGRIEKIEKKLDKCVLCLIVLAVLILGPAAVHMFF